MRKSALVLTAASGVLWGLSGASTWAGFDPHSVSIESNGACAATILAGLCWVAWAVRDRDKDVLVDAMASFSQRRGTAETRPERRLQRVI